MAQVELTAVKYTSSTLDFYVLSPKENKMFHGQWIRFIVTFLVYGYFTLITSGYPVVNMNPDAPGCECLRVQEVFDIIQKIVTRSQLKDIIVISKTSTKGCVDLGDLEAVLSIVSCSNWNSLLTSQGNHKITLSTIIIDCDVNITESIIRAVLTARRSGGEERRLLLPVYNFIVTQHIEASATHYLDLAAIHFVSIVRTYNMVLMNKKSASSDQSCQSNTKLMCPQASYDIKTRAGDQAWRVVGRYRNIYQGDPTFLRNKFVNFEGMQLKVIHELYRPFTMIDNGRHYGYCIDLLEAIAVQLNFTYVLINSVDGNFGVETANGYWNGMMGMMERKEGDMIMAGLTITGHRETVVDFSIPFFKESSAIVVRSKITNEISWSLFFDPLQSYVWMATAASLVISVLLINRMEQSATFKICNGNRKDELHPDVGQDLQGLQACTWLMICQYLRQGAVKLPSSGPVRLCLGLIWFVPLIVGWMHGANLTASLSTVKKTIPFNTLEELANDTEYTILQNGASVQRLLFEQATSGIYAALWAKIRKTYQTSLMTSSVKAMARMFNDSEGQKYAVVADHTTLTTQLTVDYSDRCDWAFIPETFFTSGLGVALPEGSPYKDIYDRAILTALRTGLTDKFRKRNFFKPSCEDVKLGTQTESKNISLGHVKTMFILLLAGIALSVFVFLLEYYFNSPHRMGQKGQPQKNE